SQPPPQAGEYSQPPPQASEYSQPPPQASEYNQPPPQAGDYNQLPLQAGDYNQLPLMQDANLRGAPVSMPSGVSDGAPADMPMGSAAGNQTAAPMGAPAERFDAPVPEKPILDRRNFAPNYRERVFVQRADEWSEPSYSQAHETAQSMYTPGIYPNQPYYRKQMPEQDNIRAAKESSGRVGRFFRVACIVILCVALSGATAYGVMEYRINRGDFTVVNQVILGGSANKEQSGGVSSSVTTAGVEMSAEDIYNMACTQVVSVKTDIESAGGIFGSSVNTVVAGSGFIISNDGYILTNYHVIETAYSNDIPLKVCLLDGTEYIAAVIGYEENNDIAVIKIDAEGLNPAVIADSDNISVGQRVYAVGNPFGELVYTMTDGIVSARDREVSVEGKTINTFQFSAAVNSGNSGGPLYNTRGEVIGIVTAKPMRTSVEGIGFAIPINDALEITAELIEHGYITGRPLIGISAQTVSSANAEYWGWVVGTRVMSVTEGSAAEKAGMMIGDIIIKLGDTETDSFETLVFALRKFKAGDTTVITVWRDGVEYELSITFDEDLTAGQPRKQQTQGQEAQQLPRELLPQQDPTLRPDDGQEQEQLPDRIILPGDGQERESDDTLRPNVQETELSPGDAEGQELQPEEAEEQELQPGDVEE
ncbi:MAG: trypsin-like peptidase domain-containing protein, partial [Oscillospiraceae bacterium]|nr:trypsin-like peptidase domain-containing protein [Oscillospiraceae bacterium]